MWSSSVKRAASSTLLATGLGAVGLAFTRLAWRPEPETTRYRQAKSCNEIPKGQRSRNDGRVTIVSQNTWNSFYAGGPQRIERMEAFRQILASNPVEIVVMQEMFTLGMGPWCDKGDVDELQRWMGDLGYVHQTSPFVTMPCLGQSSGLLICSKEPILSEQHHVFQQRRRVTAKGWLEVEVQLASRKLVILTTHLEHAHSPHWRAVRESQFREIAKRLKDLREEDVILLGDFNVCGDHFGVALDGAAEYDGLLSIMANAGLSHLAPSDDQPTLRPQHEVSLPSSPDHIFATPELKQCVNVAVWDTRQAEMVVSDHLALVATLEDTG